MDWGEIVRFIGAFTVLLVVTGLVARSIFVVLLSKDIDKFKMELKAAQEMELIKLKAKLDRLSFKGNSHSYRFQEKRADAIAKLYKLLIDVERAYKWLASVDWNRKSPDKALTDRIKKTEKLIWDHVEKNRLLIDPRITARIDRFYTKAFDAGIDYSLPNWNQATKIQNSADQLRLSFAKDIPKLRNQIETEFRLLLGSMITSEE